jgi:hypothetical protein
VWSPDTLPLPAPGDLRTEPRDVALVADDIPMLRLEARQDIAQRYLPARNHKALALATGATWFVRERGSRAEAVRMAVEGCADRWQRPCLVLSVDGFLTIQIPKSRKVTRLFLPSMETEIPVSDRERIGAIYQGAEWRALARGRNAWHAVAAAPSENAALEAALALCAQADGDCRLYAIGNFRVADE